MAVCFLPGTDGHLGLDALDNGGDGFQKGIGVFRSDAQLGGGEGDGCVLHLRQSPDLGFHFGCAVGTAQIFNKIDRAFHKEPPVVRFTYEQLLMCWC